MGEHFHCVRVYPNGHAKETLRDADGRDGWLEYNAKWRWGNTLFIDGKYVSGPMCDAEIASVEAELARRKRPTVPDTTGPQVERYGGIVDRWHGYRPEPYTQPFNLRAMEPLP